MPCCSTLQHPPPLSVGPCSGAHLASGVTPDLRAGRQPVRLGVGRVFELPQHDGVLPGRQQLLRLVQGTLEALDAAQASAHTSAHAQDEMLGCQGSRTIRRHDILYTQARAR